MISIKNLSLITSEKILLKNIQFSLNEKKISTLVGSSGSGKTTLLNLFLGITPKQSMLSYDEFILFGKNFSEYSESDLTYIRGRKVLLIPQSPSRVFHPYIPIGNQIMDFLKLKKPEKSSRKQIIDAMNEVYIVDAEKKFSLYPKFLSGGEKQRMIIQLARMISPDIILADEPTTALDSIHEKQILKLLLDTYKSFCKAMVFVTHDPRIMREISNEITQMKSGEITEKITLLQENIHNFQIEYLRNLVF